MTALKDMPISFPGLFGEWSINPNPVAIQLGNGIYWYGIIVAAAMLAGMLLCMKQAKRIGLMDGHVADIVLLSLPLAIVGARAYYVVFNLSLYRDAEGALDWTRMVAVWDGGLAIYGGIIAGILAVAFYARRKRLPFGAMTDLLVMAPFVNRATVLAE